MKKYSLVYTIILFMAFGVFFANQVSAASNTLNFQSKIVNGSDGTNVTTGTPACVVAGSGNDTCDFRVNIYSASSAGTLYFSETHSNVEIGQYNGIFNLAINSVCTTSSGSSDGNWTNSGSSCVSNGGVDFSSSNLWIEIAFAPGGAGSFTETFSRVQIKDVASARYAVNSTYLSGYAYSDFVRFTPSSAQTTASSASLISLASTGSSSAPMVIINENGPGTPDLLRLQTAGSTVFGVSNTGSLTMVGDLVNTSTGTVGLFNTNVTTLNIGGATSTLNLAGGVGSTGCTINASGDLACLGSGTFTSSLEAGFTTFNLINTTATTINFGGAATTLNIAGGSGSTGCTINSAGDITCSGDITATGGDLVTTATTATLFNTGATVAVNIAGAAATTNIGGTTVNLAGGVGSTGCTIDSAGALTCTGGVAATVAADSLDYIDFEDTMDLDAALILNQGTNIWTQNFTGTTTVGKTYNTNSLTTGTGFAIASTATGFTTGNLASITLSGNNAANAGDLLELSVTGTLSAARGLYINNLGTGDSLRIDDVASDTTPFVIDATGKVGIGTPTPQDSLEVAGSIRLAASGDQLKDYNGNNLINNTGGVLNRGNSSITSQIFTVSTGGSTYFRRNPTADLYISGTGNVAIGGEVATSLFNVGSLAVFQINSAGNIASIGGAAHSISNSSGLSITSAATALNLQSDGSININIGGGSSATGCTITNSTGDITCTGDVTATGGDLITTSTTAALFNTGATTLSIGGAATTMNIGPGGATAATINIGGGSGATGCTVAGVDGDFQCSGFANFFGGSFQDSLESQGSMYVWGMSSFGSSFGFLNNIPTNTYASFHPAGTTESSLRINSSGGVNVSAPVSGDLWWNGTNLNFRAGGTTVDLLAGGSIGADSLDYIDFEDTMDLDAALTLNQGSNTWTQNFTGTSTVGQTYNANSVSTGSALRINMNGLTGGRGVYLSSSASAMVGDLLFLENNSTSASNTGNMANIWIGGTTTNLRGLMMTNDGLGESIRINDTVSDTTPFVIDASGNLSVGGNINTSIASIDLLNTTATTINFGGAASTLNIGPGSTTATNVNIAGGSGATGCTVAGATGNLTCSGTISGTFSMAADSLDYIDFQDTLDLDNHLTYNQSSFIVTQNFTGTTTVGTTYNVNSLTSGTGFAVISSSTGLTTGGSVATIGLTGSNAANIGDVLEIFQTGTLSGAKVINMSNYGTGDSIRIDDVSGDTTPFIIDASGNVSVGGNINTSLTSIDVVNTTATTVNFAGAATTLALAGGSGSTGCTINSSGDITCTGDVTATGGDLITTAATATLFNSGATTLSIGGAATTLNIGPGAATAGTIHFLGGSGTTGCSMTGNDGAFTCTSTITGGGFSTAGNISGGGITGTTLTGNNSITTGGTLTGSGINNFGSGSTDYTPTNVNWSTIGGTTLILNALNYSALGFHDNGARVDFIRTGAGVMTLGYDGGWGNASVAIPGVTVLGSGAQSATSLVTARQSNVGDPVMHIINTGNAGGAQALHVQGCQNTPNTTCNLIILYDGDGTQAGRIQINAAGGTNYQTTSDVRAKKDITDTVYSLEDLLKVRVRDYKYLEGSARTTGFVAQELYNVYPEAVGQGLTPDEMWAVDYGAMTPLIVQGVQDLNDIVVGNSRSISDLKIRDTELLALINGLTTRVAGLETRVATLEGAQSGSGAAVDLVNFMATNGTFAGSLTVAGNTNVKGKVYFGNDNVGEAKILAGDTEVTIVFDTAFETMPIVQVTPQSDNFLTLPVKYVVSEKAKTKFKIKIDVAQLEDLVFNWSVSGTRDGVQIDSDGNVANL